MKQQFEYGFYRLPQVVEITTLSKSRIYDLMSSGDFPKNISLGRRTSVWNRRDVEEWCNKKVLTTAA